MNNESVIKQFILNGAVQGGTAKRTILNGYYTFEGRTLWIDGNRLVNYNTEILSRSSKGFTLNISKYSVTTSKIQSKIKRILEQYNIPYTMIEVEM